MTNSDWYRKRNIFWLFIVCNLSIGTDGQYNNACQSASGGPGICVVKRYCRERFKERLSPCTNEKVCCPLPTTPSPSTTTPVPVPTKEPGRRFGSPLPSNPKRAANGSRTDTSGREYPFETPNEFETPKYDPCMSRAQDGALEENPPRAGNDGGRLVYAEDDRASRIVNDRRRPNDFERPKYDPCTDGRQDGPIDTSPPGGRDDNGRPKYAGDGRTTRVPNDHRPNDRQRPNDFEKPKYDPPCMDESQDGPSDESSPRGVDNGGRPRYAGDDGISRVPNDGRRGDPVSFKSVEENLRRGRRQISRDYDDYDGEITLRRLGDSEGSRQNWPIDDYGEPFEDYSKSNRDQQSRPVGRPRTEVERIVTRPKKVDYEDEYSYDDRPSVTETRPTDNEDRGKPEFSSGTRKERPRQNHSGDDRRRDPPRCLRPTRDRPREPEKPIEAPMPEDPQPQVPGCGVNPYEMFRIAGGTTAREHEWPWMTAIYRRQVYQPKVFICGGALINTKYVLTAAHCFVNKYGVLPASSFVVRLGAHKLEPPSGEEFAVSEVVVHDNYTVSNFFNDIALIKVAGTVYMTDKMAPICMPSPGMRMQDFVGKMATVAGWGDIAHGITGSRTLQHVTIPIISGEECSAAYSRMRGVKFLQKGSEHIICAGLREGQKDACHADSGGPLMLKGSDDRWIMVGIVSFGYKCAEPGYPGVYARVTHYVSWIQAKTRKL